MDSSDGKINRREFLQKGALRQREGDIERHGAVVCAHSGANDRISLGTSGSAIGQGTDGIVASLKRHKETRKVTAVCDLWSHNLEQAATTNQKYFRQSSPRLPTSARPAWAERCGRGDDFHA